MRRLYLLLGLIALVSCCISPLPADDVSLRLPALTNYVGKADPTYSWKLQDKKEIAGTQTYLIKLTSQKWQNITWEHDLLLIVPKEAPANSDILLFNTIPPRLMQRLNATYTCPGANALPASMMAFSKVNP